MTAQPPSAAQTRLSRRSLLFGAVAVSAAACTTRPQRATADLDAAALTAARDTEHRLLAGYDAAHPAYAAHLAHLHALGAPSPSPSSTPPAALSAARAAGAERASVAALQGAANAAVHGSNAALLASIAASHAVLGGVAR